MIWRPGPEAPLLLRFAADGALVLHVGGGLVAILSGFVVLAAPKGRRAHRLAGTTFFAAMLAMAGVAAVVAPLIADRLAERITNTNAAVFALYLTLTGWAAMKRPPGASGRAERLLVLVPAAIVLEAAGLALASARTGLRGLETVYVFAALAALAATCDLRVLAADGARGPSRTARHLWRMCAALFIAAGSLFLGRQGNFPAALQGTVWLLIPPFAVLGSLLFWMVKVRWPRRRRRAPALAG